MDKSQIPLSRLVEQYFTTCRTEGKTPSTLRGYREKLGRFVLWCDEATLSEFSVELAREYVAYLQSAPKWENHPTLKPDGSRMSAQNIANHVRTLRAFSSWLHREGFTQENILARIKVPKTPKKIITTLSDEEISQLFGCLDQNTATGCRNAAMLILFLDTGLRCSELLNLGVEHVHLPEQWLKVMGKGQKERAVPFGGRASKLLQRYIVYFRPEPVVADHLFLTIEGFPLTENAIKLIFARIAKKAGVERLHIHLLRHTFATRYLLNGGDAFSLQQILGHTTLEMTRRYVDAVAVERAVKTKRPSPMDVILTGRNGRQTRGNGTGPRKRKT